jgi:hypothetical protein
MVISKKRKASKPRINKAQRDRLFQNNRNFYDVENVIKQKKFFESTTNNNSNY